MSAINLTQDNFEDEVKKSSLPVLVDFWAEWCGPCKAIAPMIEELAGEMQGTLKVGKVNVDEAQELAAQFSIMSIPTLILFKNGEVAEQVVGAVSKDQLLEKINQHI